MKSMCHDVRRNSPSVAALQADVLLHPHDLADRLVLDAREAPPSSMRPGGVLLARREERGRAQQAADVVGAERRPLASHRASVRDSLERGQWRVRGVCLRADYMPETCL